MGLNERKHLIELIKSKESMLSEVRITLLPNADIHVLRELAQKLISAENIKRKP